MLANRKELQVIHNLSTDYLGVFDKQGEFFPPKNPFRYKGLETYQQFSQALIILILHNLSFYSFYLSLSAYRREFQKIDLPAPAGVKKNKAISHDMVDSEWFSNYDLSVCLMWRNGNAHTIVGTGVPDCPRRTIICREIGEILYKIRFCALFQTNQNPIVFGQSRTPVPTMFEMICSSLHRHKHQVITQKRRRFRASL